MGLVFGQVVGWMTRRSVFHCHGARVIPDQKMLHVIAGGGKTAITGIAVLRGHSLTDLVGVEVPTVVSSVSVALYLRHSRLWRRSTNSG
jgi:hypothetical protein